MSEPLQLYYGSIKVGQILDWFLSDDIWHGRFEAAIGADDGPVERRLLEFIQFSSDWNQKVTDNPAEPPDAVEFDRFADVIRSNKWSVLSARGQSRIVEEAPVFFQKDQITWRETTAH